MLGEMSGRMEHTFEGDGPKPSRTGFLVGAIQDREFQGRTDMHRERKDARLSVFQMQFLWSMSAK